MTTLLTFLLSVTVLADAPTNRTFTVDGEKRDAVVCLPSQKTSEAGAPLVLFFHGHGGRAQGAATRYAIHKLWPEAIVIYPQGLTGVKGITDPDGSKPGWQKNPGELKDRDVKLVDVLLETIMKEQKVDPKRIYALGHSNGARFTHVVWKMRGDKFAAFCAGAGPGTGLFQGAPLRSVFMIAGEKDPLVAFESMKFSIESARKLLKTDSEKSKTDGLLKTEMNSDGLELATYLHAGGHEWPKEATPLVVKFFQRHVLK